MFEKHQLQGVVHLRVILQLILNSGEHGLCLIIGGVRRCNGNRADGRGAGSWSGSPRGSGAMDGWQRTSKQQSTLHRRIHHAVTLEQRGGCACARGRPIFVPCFRYTNESIRSMVSPTGPGPLYCRGCGRRSGMQASLHSETASVFRVEGQPITRHRHQAQAIAKATAMRNFVVTTGTDSGKSLCSFVLIIDAAIRARAPGRRRAPAIVGTCGNLSSDIAMGHLSRVAIQSCGRTEARRKKVLDESGLEGSILHFARILYFLQ
jgi:hypothetical protein